MPAYSMPLPHSPHAHLHSLGACCLSPPACTACLLQTPAFPATCHLTACCLPWVSALTPPHSACPPAWVLVHLPAMPATAHTSFLFIRSPPYLHHCLGSPHFYCIPAWVWEVSGRFCLLSTHSLSHCLGSLVSWRVPSWEVPPHLLGTTLCTTCSSHSMGGGPLPGTLHMSCIPATWESLPWNLPTLISMGSCHFLSPAWDSPTSGSHLPTWIPIPFLIPPPHLLTPHLFTILQAHTVSGVPASATLTTHYWVPAASSTTTTPTAPAHLSATCLHSLLPLSACHHLCVHILHACIPYLLGLPHHCLHTGGGACHHLWVGGRGCLTFCTCLTCISLPFLLGGNDAPLLHLTRVHSPACACSDAWVCLLPGFLPPAASATTHACLLPACCSPPAAHRLLARSLRRLPNSCLPAGDFWITCLPLAWVGPAACHSYRLHCTLMLPGICSACLPAA